MEFADLPGITIDVPILLQALGKATALNVVRSLVAETHVEPSGDTPRLVFTKARGISIDVVELLQSLENDDLISAVQKGFDVWKDVKSQVLQDVYNFVEFRPCSTSTTTDGSVLTNESIFCISVTSPRDQGKLPSISLHRDRHITDPSLLSLSRKPPRPGKAGIAGSRSTPCLPQLPKSGDPSETCADRDARQLGERLLQAVQTKDVSSVQSLLVARANIEQKNKDGSNATTLAMMQGTPYNILRALLEGRANINAIDGQNRSLAHLWAWTLPKTKNGVREAQKKLSLLVNFRADLNSRLPVTGDSPLHILARVYNTLSMRAVDARDGHARREVDDVLADTERFKKCTQSRILLMTGSGASTSVRNGEGKKPFSLIDPKFRFILQPIVEEDETAVGNGSDACLSFAGKSRRIELQEETSINLD